MRRVVVRCGDGHHRVRLATGVRFWRTAHCPNCRARVDPYRIGRIGAWLKNLGRPASDRVPHRVLWWSVVGFIILIFAALVLLWGLGDIWWPSTALLFGPRWVLALPLVVLVPAALLLDRALLLPLGVATVILAGPIIELRTGWRSLAISPDPSTDLRVVTYNIEGGGSLSSTAGGMAQRWEADILLFQECGGVTRQEIETLARDSLWHGDARGSLCILSRFPVTAIDEMERSALRAAGGSGLVVTYEIDMDGRAVHVTNVHLETPRDGFALLRSGQLIRSIPVIQEKSYMRRIELSQARRWVDRRVDTPRIVAGDFNTPPESRAYRDSWSDWTNAFSHVGRGYGGTRLNGWIRPRIDHVLVDRNWQVVDAGVGDDLGSDHLPVIATLRPRRPAGR